jgi:hypothetical protein
MNVREGLGLQHTVVDDANITALLGDENPTVGRDDFGGRRRQAADQWRRDESGW